MLCYFKAGLFRPAFFMVGATIIDFENIHSLIF